MHLDDPTFRGGFAAAILCLAAGAAAAAEWPQYRGPDRSGVSAEEGLLTSWTESGPAELWRRPIGGGFSAVSIADGRLYTMEALGLEEAVLAVDPLRGETIWRRVVGETDPELFPGSGPRSTPTYSEGALFTVTSTSRLLALDAASGEILWDADLTVYGPTPRFGYSVSPLVDGDNVIVLVGDREKEPGVVSFHRATGEVRWQASDGPAGYSSPILAEIGGVRQYVFATFGGILGLDIDGRELWFHDTGPKTALPMPVFGPPDRVFVATADDSFGGMMIRVVRGERSFTTEEIWTERLMRNHFNTSVLVEGHLYGFDNATFRCLDAATGERKWARRGFGKGSIVAAGNLIYVLSDNGTLTLLHADGDAYREAGRIKVTEGRSWTTPSLADGRLYVRDFDELVSLDLTTAGTLTAEAGAATPGAVTVAGEASVTEGLTVDTVVERYVAARGGADSWSRIEALELRGVYAAFSEESPFTLVRRRGDRFRLDFELLGGAAVRARDGETVWWQHALLQPEPAPADEHPYRAQLERESMFGPPLLDHEARGIEVALAGESEINGQRTIDLEVTLPDGAKETWHLDPESFLEVAIDSEIYDFTQFREPTRQRAFFSDWREVAGVRMPFRLDTEFGARLEEMRVEEIIVNPAVDPRRLQAPPPPAAPEEGETGEDAPGEGS